jgi:hypothetical protein
MTEYATGSGLASSGAAAPAARDGDDDAGGPIDAAPSRVRWRRNE